MRGLSTGGNLRFKIDWASLIVGSKLTAFTLFYFVFEGNFPSKSPGGLIHGGAYFRNFTVLKGDKPHFRLTCIAQKRPCLSALICIKENVCDVASKGMI